MATMPKKDSAPEPAPLRSDSSDTGTLQDKPTPEASERGDHDRIVMASRRPDGSMAQIDPEFIGDKETAVRAAREQRAVQAASAVDVAARGVSSEPAGAAGSSEPDAEIKALREAQDKAAEAAADQAEREVNELHKGLGD